MSVAEPVAEPSPRVPSDLGRIVVLLLLALSLRAFTIANTTVPSRDCIVFVRDGLQLETPPAGMTRLDVIRKVEHPPGYPAAIIAMSWIVRPIMGATAPTVESMRISAQLVSLVAGVLLVLPLFLIARRLFDRNVAFAAVAIFIVLPVCVEVTSDGISDSVFLLTAAWAMWFAIRALERETRRGAFLFAGAAGLFCGIGYTIRPDAAIVALGIGVTFLTLVVRRLRSGGWKLPLVAGLGLTVGTAVGMSPYCIAIQGLSKKMTAIALIELLFGKKPDKTYFENPESSQRGVNLPIAAWWNAKAHEGQTKSIWAAKALWSEYSKAAHYSVPGFALIGLIALRRRLSDPRIGLLVAIGGIHLAVLWLMAWQINYVSQRHTLLTVMITCIFAAVSLPVLGAWFVRNAESRWFRRKTAWQMGAVVAVMIMLSALPRDFRSLHRERAGHKAAGHWIAEYGDKSIPVVDPFGWADWYAGRTLRDYPNPNPQPDRELYLIFEPNAKSPHSRLGTYEFTKQHSAGQTIVYRYPEDAPPDKILVAVYHFKPTKKPQ
jgi:hypothetical protein